MARKTHANSDLGIDPRRVDGLTWALPGDIRQVTPIDVRWRPASPRSRPRGAQAPSGALFQVSRIRSRSAAMACWSSGFAILKPCSAANSTHMLRNRSFPRMVNVPHFWALNWRAARTLSRRLLS